MTTDVLVVGGGPAGSTLALRLAALGFDVTLAEKSRFPRRQIGESSPPALLPILAHLGVIEEMRERSALAAAGAVISWARDGAYQRIERDGEGWVLDRGLFDQILLDAARRAGIRVLQPATIAAVTSGEDGVRRARLTDHDGDVEIEARFVGIAAGRSGRLGGRRKRQSPATVALYGYWRAPPSWPDWNIVEAAADGWCWSARLPDGGVNAAAFVDPHDRRLKDAASPLAAYRACLRASPSLAKLLEGELDGLVHVTDASRQLVAPVVGADFLRVGDAALSLDPLSAQGTVTAMALALQGAAIVNTLLRRPADAASAMEFARARQRESVDRDRQAGAEHYRSQAAVCATAFWTRRAADAPRLAAPGIRPSGTLPEPDAPLWLSADATIGLEPVLDGDFIAPRAALAHPGLDRPLAFVRNVPATRLLQPLRQGRTAAFVLQDWSAQIGPQQAAALLGKLWQRGIVMRAPSGADLPVGMLQLLEQGRDLAMNQAIIESQRAGA